MTKIKVTTIEQSDKLVELGIDPNTADLSYVMEPTLVDGQIHYLNGYDLSIMSYESAKETLDKFFSQHKPFANVKPAWSLSALLDVIRNKNINAGLFVNDTMWVCDIVLNDSSFTSMQQDNQVEAVLESIKWLYEKENND